jgi:hypothetical protein
MIESMKIYTDELIREGLINAKNESLMRLFLSNVIRVEKNKSMESIKHTLSFLEDDDWIRLTIEKEINNSE